MTQSRSILGGKVFAAAQLGCGAFFALGSAGELAASIVPGMLPDEVSVELSRLHASFGVRAWVLVQNVGTLLLGCGFVAAAIGLWRRRGWAISLTRRCAIGTIGVLALGQLVLSICLYPDLLAGHLDVDAPDTWFIILLCSGLAAMFWPVIALVATSRASSVCRNQGLRRG